MKIEMIEMQPETAMAIKKTANMSNVKEIIQEGYAKLWTYISEAGGEVSNAPYAAYLGMGEEFEMEMGFPVKAALPAKNDIFVSQTPSGKAVTGTHTGSYDGLSQAYGKLMTFIKENKIAPVGQYYDFYLNDPSVTPEDELTTKIVIPVREGEMTVCQSCGMPLAAENDFGTEKDGGRNKGYCTYCYKDGVFTADMTMDEMISFCAEHAEEWGMDETKEQAIVQMRELFPTLKRWK